MPLIHRNQLSDATIRGEEHGASISLILDESEPGHGPRLHRHAYDETWVVQDGNISFQAGDDLMKAGPGDVVIVPPGVPHRFINNGPGRSRIVCIHASPKIVGEWLE